jgi:hypothetical protein
MRIHGSARAVVAVVAAYAVALQTILLVFGGSIASADGLSRQTICSHYGGDTNGRAPAGHGRDCLADCLTGCSCGAVAVPVRAVALLYAPELLQRVAALGPAKPAIWPSAIRAHRSRAPPFG